MGFVEIYFMGKENLCFGIKYVWIMFSVVCYNFILVFNIELV